VKFELVFAAVIYCRGHTRWLQRSEAEQP